VQYAPIVEAIAGQLQTEPVMRADETIMRVNKALRTLTWVGRHTKRGKTALDNLGHPGALRWHAASGRFGALPAAELHASSVQRTLPARANPRVRGTQAEPWAGRMIELLTRANQIKRRQQELRFSHSSQWLMYSSA